MLWKNGAVSAASTSGGGLKVPLPSEFRKPRLRASKLSCARPWPPNPASKKGCPSKKPMRPAVAMRVPVSKLRFLLVSMKVAPAFWWQMLQRPRCGFRKA